MEDLNKTATVNGSKSQDCFKMIFEFSFRFNKSKETKTYFLEILNHKLEKRNPGKDNQLFRLFKEDFLDLKINYY